MAFTGYNNGYNTYREIGVKTASQGKLVVMLYEGAVSEIEKAIPMIGPNGKIDANKIESFGNHLQKVMDIITELQVSLDMESGGEIAKNLLSLYVYFNKELLECTIKHDRKKLETVLDMLRQLRDSWVQAAASTANLNKMPDSQTSLNITG
ncbi:MAG: flagellar export chaperone FliS [Treponema sp.]|nr:flagellar export chaperone FliS [Treponema sp.]